MLSVSDRVLLSFEFPDYDDLSALDFSSFIYDFNRLYVSAFRLLNGDVRPVGGYGFSRNNFVLPRTAELKIGRIRFESPLLLDFFAVISTGGLTIFTVMQILEKADAWPQQKRKLDLEVRKLELEVENLESAKRAVETADRNRHPEIYSATGSLSRSRLQPQNIGIKIDKKI